MTAAAHLEAAIRANRDDPAAYEVYADWLLLQGDATGELITLECALARRPERTKEERAAELRAALAPPTDLATADAEWGLWRSLHIHKRWPTRPLDALALARDLFARSTCVVLEELRIGALNWAQNELEIPAVLAEAGRHRWAPELRALRLGDTGGPGIEQYIVGAVGARISASFPGLESLVIRSGHARRRLGSFAVDGLDLPRLVTLTVETYDLPAARVEQVLSASLPELERLELWLGGVATNGDLPIEALAPLLDGVRHAGVRHLGLRNAQIADAVAQALPGSAIARRLVSLDLSLGTLSDDGALALAAGAASFPALARLNIDDNFVGARGLAALQTAFAHVALRAFRQKEPVRDHGEEYRFISVTE